jgi:hypothetical protein
MKQLKTGPMSEFQQLKERVRMSSKVAVHDMNRDFDLPFKVETKHVRALSLAWISMGCLLILSGTPWKMHIGWLVGAVGAVCLVTSSL